MSAKRKANTSDQSARFIEDARKLGVDESGKAFERAFKKIAPAKPSPKGSKTARA